MLSYTDEVVHVKQSLLDLKGTSNVTFHELQMLQSLAEFGCCILQVSGIVQFHMQDVYG